MNKIRTPKGKLITAAQYVGLWHSLSNRTGGAAFACHTYGHIDCAAWKGGPCSAEMQHKVEAASAERPAVFRVVHEDTTVKNAPISTRLYRGLSRDVAETIFTRVRDRLQKGKRVELYRNDDTQKSVTKE